MNLTDLLYQEVVPAIKKKDRASIIGEGSQAEIYDRFVCKNHRDICFKVFYPGAERARDEYEILVALYNQGLPVPKPLELFDEANAFAMQKITGYNLEEVVRKGLKLSQEVADGLNEAVTLVTGYVNHNDLSIRNVMLGDIEIEDGIIVDAEPFVIDFGVSTLKQKSRSEEGSVIRRALRNLTV